LQITSLATGAAIVNAVFAQANFIEALAQSAVLVAGAASLRLVADHAHEFLGHGGRLSRFGFSGNGPMVDGLAVSGGERLRLTKSTRYWQNAKAERKSGGSG
jgi:hypothetical protein